MAFLTGIAIAFFAASATASAADLPSKIGYPPPPPPIYNWTGFYIGANIGDAWASGGSLTDNVTGASINADNSAAVIGGGTFGYNWQFAPNWVIGLEGTFDGTSITTNRTVYPAYFGVPVSIQGSTNTNWVSTAAVRFGVAANNWLFYAKGGGGWANNSVSLTGVALAGPAGFVGGTLNASKTAGGGLGGFGIEYGLTQNWTVKAEYDYLGLSPWSISAPFALGDSINVSRNVNIFTVGANYKF